MVQLPRPSCRGSGPAPQVVGRCFSTCKPLRSGASGFRSSCARVARNSSFRRSASRSASAVRRVSSSSRAFSAVASLQLVTLAGDLLPLAPELEEHTRLAAQNVRLDGLGEKVDGPGLVPAEPALVVGGCPPSGR